MAIENGNAFRIRLDTEYLVGETSTGISYSANLIEVTTKVTKGYVENIPGVKSATIQFEKLHTFEEVLEVGDKVTFHVGPSTQGYAGECIIDSIVVDSSSDGVQTYSGTASVTGEVAKFIPIYALEYLVDNNGNNITTDSGDSIVVSVQQN